jgi:putative endonuclease
VPFLYILRCGDGTLYTGLAKDLGARIRQHQAGRAARYTRARLPVRLLWSREVATWAEGLREERRIKRLRRRDKEALLAGVTRRDGARGRAGMHRRPRAD